MFDIQAFSAAMNKLGGPARNNLFHVRITGGPAIGDFFGSEVLSYLCSSATLPGFDATTVTYMRQGFGLEEKRINNLNLGDFTCIFIVDSGHGVTRIMHRWMQYAINYNTLNYDAQVNGMYPYQLAYRDDIVAQAIDVRMMDTKGNETYLYTLYDAHPVNVGSIDLSWADTNNYIQLPVTFTYSKFKVSDMLGGSYNGFTQN